MTKSVARLKVAVRVVSWIVSPLTLYVWVKSLDGMTSGERWGAVVQLIGIVLVVVAVRLHNRWRIVGGYWS